MRNIASHSSVRILALLLFGLAGCTAQLYAASCDQPVVTWQSEQLRIYSTGCSLQQILTAVAGKTGLQFQVPASASTVQVFANLGPEEPTQVLSKLLEGTRFDWSLATDGAVVLTERSGFPKRRAEIDDELIETPPKPPLCTSEFTKGTALNHYCMGSTDEVVPQGSRR